MLQMCALNRRRNFHAAKHSDLFAKLTHCIGNVHRGAIPFTQESDIVTESCLRQGYYSPPCCRSVSLSLRKKRTN